MDNDEMLGKGIVEEIGCSTGSKDTCKRVVYERTGTMVCSECGGSLSRNLESLCVLKYCPTCGRRIV